MKKRSMYGEPTSKAAAWKVDQALNKQPKTGIAADKDLTKSITKAIKKRSIAERAAKRKAAAKLGQDTVMGAMKKLGLRSIPVVGTAMTMMDAGDAVAATTRRAAQEAANSKLNSKPGRGGQMLRKSKGKRY